MLVVKASFLNWHDKHASDIFYVVFSGPTHVLVVRGLDENADEEMLRYEFSKHAPLKVQCSICFPCCG